MSIPVAIVNDVQRDLTPPNKGKTFNSMAFNGSNHSSEQKGDVSQATSENTSFIVWKIYVQKGESYSGFTNYRNPEGSGLYIWSDGCTYEGEWRSGMRHGYGKLQWPPGALYEGEFSGGYMHGSGMYTRPGMTYKGRWRLNIKHGLGYQQFSNGDVFGGSWMQGTPEGHGKYAWANGNVYMGNMKGGTMLGKGTLTWINGDLYEGTWLNGMMHGFGVYTWSDGSCYAGNYTRGLKDGKGTFYPKGNWLPSGQQLCLSALRQQGLLPDLRKQNVVSHIHGGTSVDMEDVNVGQRNPRRNLFDNLPRRVPGNQQESQVKKFGRSWSLEVSIEKSMGQEISDNASGEDNVNYRNHPILERELRARCLLE